MKYISLLLLFLAAAIPASAATIDEATASYAAKNYDAARSAAD